LLYKLKFHLEFPRIEWKILIIPK
ncbi:hypothetical protein Zm00014a_001077, partial [Zea mays]